MEEQHLKQIELLLTQSLNGIHLLFDREHIANILKIPTEELNLFEGHKIGRIQDLFNKLIENSTFSEKKVFLSSLDQESYELLLRAYFHIVDNTVLMASNYEH